MKKKKRNRRAPYRMPKGFYVQRIGERDSYSGKSTYYFNLKLRTSVGHMHLGEVVLEHVEGESWQTHSELHMGCFRGRGLGYRLYAHAIRYGLRKGWKITSSTHPSYDAKRVWKGRSLRSLFQIRSQYGRYRVIKEK